MKNGLARLGIDDIEGLVHVVVELQSAHISQPPTQVSELAAGRRHEADLVHVNRVGAQLVGYEGEVELQLLRTQSAGGDRIARSGLQRLGELQIELVQH